jgi:hypothetical protein
MMRYFIGFIAAIGLIILLIVLLLTGGGDNKQAPKTPKALDEYGSTSALVRMTIDGPINADSEHKQLRITVGKDDVVYEQVNGYNGDVVNTKVYTNTQDSYTDFLHALGHAGFTRGSDEKALADERGFCPLGRRNIFELIQDNKTLERYWSTSCGSPKSYRGNNSLTIQLFQDQVPDYNKLSQNLGLAY